MATNIDINITDMSGHTFTIKLHWDICIMTCQIAQHYEDKFKTEFCKEKGIAQNELNCDYNSKFCWEWYNSDYYKTLNNTHYKLIYKGEILEQYHVEADLITEEDLQENNNMNVVICKNPRKYDYISPTDGYNTDDGSD